MKAFQSSAFKNRVEQAVHKWVIWTHVVDAVATRSIDDPTFIIPAEMLVTQTVQNLALVKAQTE